MLTPFYTRRNWSSDRLGNLPKATQIINGSAGEEKKKKKHQKTDTELGGLGHSLCHVSDLRKVGFLFLTPKMTSPTPPHPLPLFWCWGSNLAP